MYCSGKQQPCLHFCCFVLFCFVLLIAIGLQIMLIVIMFY